MKLRALLLVASVIYSSHSHAGTECVNNPACDFHFPLSSVQLLDPSWLRGLSRDTLWEARNEILARHGYAFETPRALRYFSSKPYWSPRTHNVHLSGIEKTNVALLRSFEEQLGSSNAGAPLMGEIRVTGLDPKGDGFLAVRSGPGVAYPQVASLLEGDRATVTATSGAWRKIRYWGGDGWAHSRWMTPISQPSTSLPALEISADADTSLSASEVAKLHRDVAAMTAQIRELKEALNTAEQNPAIEPQRPAQRETVTKRVVQLEDQRRNVTTLLERYATPVHPTSSTQPTARQLSETLQKVPYFIPGTNFIGEIWIEPSATENGELAFIWNFIDPNAEYNKITLSMKMSPEEVSQAAAALNQIEEWAKTAQENKVRRVFEKRAACFPEPNCNDAAPQGPATALLFQIAADGSTSMAVKHKQGRLERHFSFSIESTAALSAYFKRMLDEASSEFHGATASDQELDALFD